MVSRSEIISDYVDWVSNDEYVILKRQCLLVDEVGSEEDNPVELSDNFFKEEAVGVLVSKRGNSAYVSRVEKRFYGLARGFEKVRFFDPNSRGKLTTKALWVTLTYDPSLCSWFESWERVGVEINRFMSYIRKKFGKVSLVRVNESFKNGFVHVHMILLFRSKLFQVFRFRGKFRVVEKPVIAEGWHSFVDVQGLPSLTFGFKYLSKYLTKCVSFDKSSVSGLLTLAFCWFFKKRSFSVGGVFRQVLHDLIQLSITQTSCFVRLTFGVVFRFVTKYTFVGIVPASVLRWKPQCFGVLSDSEFEYCVDFLSIERSSWNPFVEEFDVSWVSSERCIDEFFGGDF